jgi:hypothetical protein
MKDGQFQSVDDVEKPKQHKYDYTPWLKNADHGDVPPCVYADNLLSYFNSAEVKKALNIDDSFNNGNQWFMCLTNYAGTWG